MINKKPFYALCLLPGSVHPIHIYGKAKNQKRFRKHIKDNLVSPGHEIIIKKRQETDDYT